MRSGPGALRAAAGVGAALALIGPAGPALAAWGPAGGLAGPGVGRIWSLAISPASASVALAGTDDGLQRSADGGRSWTPLGLAGHRVWTLGFDARNSSTIYAGLAGGGVQRSTDGGATWADASSGLTNLNVRSLALGLDGLAAGTDDGVALSGDGEHWRGGGPGDPLHGYSISSVAVAANSPQFTVIAGADSGNLSRGSLFRSNAAGGWDVLQAGLPTDAAVSSVAAGGLSAAVTRRPLMVNTSRGSFRSGDSGTSWTESAGIPKDPAPVTLTSSVFSPLDPNLVYAAADAGGSGGGELLRSTDGGASFTPASQGLPERNRNVASLAVSATSPPQLLAAIDAPSGAAVFRESDGSAPSPPSPVGEASGSIPVPAVAPTPTPAAPPAPRTPPAPAASGPGPVASFLGAAFHFPVPLILEIPLAGLIAFVIVRWRRHYLDVEGPP